MTSTRNRKNNKRTGKKERKSKSYKKQRKSRRLKKTIKKNKKNKKNKTKHHKKSVEKLLSLSRDNKEEVHQHIIKGSYKPGEKYFVMLHVSWCPHCTDALPHFEQLEKHVKSDKKFKGFNVENFECEAGYPDLKPHAGAGFPTIFTFQDNKREEYEMPRTFDSMKGFLESMISKKQGKKQKKASKGCKGLKGRKDRQPSDILEMLMRV